jgi:hypothetical protein
MYSNFDTCTRWLKLRASYRVVGDISTAQVTVTTPTITTTTPSMRFFLFFGKVTNYTS